MDSLKKRFPIYAKIIKLYPAEYQKEYAQQILQTTADMLDNAQNASSKILIWSQLIIDLPINITKQQLHYAGGVYMKETPAYIKTNSVLASLLLIPFVIVLSANGLDKVMFHHTLFDSWLWKMPALGLWVLYLPSTAFLLAMGSYLFYVAQHKTRLMRRALDIQHLWPIVIPAILAFGILFIVAFHDSIQCWVQTPAYLVTHASQAWQCTTQNQALKIFQNRF